MKKIFFTVGPSQIYQTIPLHLKNAVKEDILSISHRGEEFAKIYKNCQDLLRKLLDIPQKHRILFLSSSIEAMDRIIENCVDKYSFHFVDGIFADKFYKAALKLKKKAVKVESPFGRGFNFGNKIPKETELICITQNETTSGVAFNMEEIYKLKKKYSDKLLALDIVSSAPYVKVDFSFIDLCFFSVQKAFGLPAGLSILVVSPKALNKSENLSKSKKTWESYHSFRNLIEKDNKLQTVETPNVLAIYLLGKVCEDFRNYGIEKIRIETDEKAKMIYKFLDSSHIFEPLVKDSRLRSTTTIVVKVKGGSERIAEWLSKKSIIVGKGYGKYRNEHIRIANFPAHRKSDVERLIRELGKYELKSKS